MKHHSVFNSCRKSLVQVNGVSIRGVSETRSTGTACSNPADQIHLPASNELLFIFRFSQHLEEISLVGGGRLKRIDSRLGAVCGGWKQAAAAAASGWMWHMLLLLLLH